MELVLDLAILAFDCGWEDVVIVARRSPSLHLTLCVRKVRQRQVTIVSYIPRTSSSVLFSKSNFSSKVCLFLFVGGGESESGSSGGGDELGCVEMDGVRETADTDAALAGVIARCLRLDILVQRGLQTVK